MCIRDSLYVIPRFCTAFVDPFAEIPTLSMLCSFFNKDGEPLASAPEHTLSLHDALPIYNFNEVRVFQQERDGIRKFNNKGIVVYKR